LNTKNQLRIGWGDFSTYRTELYGISALWIMIFHCNNVKVNYSGSFLPLKVIEEFIDHGNSGVEIFLFLSGMSLYFAYSKCQGQLLYFQKRRFSRLLIPVFVIYLPYWILWTIAPGDFSLVPNFALKLTTFELLFNGNREIWFIPFMAACYLAYPYLYETFQCSARKRNLRLLVLLGITVLITYCLLVGAGEFYDTFEIAITRIPIFILGCWAGKLVKHKVPMPKWTIPVAYLAVLYWMYRYIYAPVKLPMFEIRYEYFFSSMAFMVVYIHIVRLFNWNWLKKFLHFFGNRSLELYLSHLMLIAVYRLMPFYEHDNALNYVLLLVCATAVAYVAEKITSVIHSKLIK